MVLDAIRCGGRRVTTADSAGGTPGLRERRRADTAGRCSCGDASALCRRAGGRALLLPRTARFRPAFSHRFHDHISLLPPRPLQIQPPPLPRQLSPLPQ